MIYRTGTENVKDAGKGRSFNLLRQINLRVSKTNYNYTKLLGTETPFKRGYYKSMCPGDSGGPLMYETQESKRWVIIG